jgi:methylenetetrahydrofolate dehydrogenase (NADP+)/methenyltetrahydrofolate cyclohydrolase
MTARVLDGAATASAIRDELRDRVAALVAAGRRPGLAVLLVGDDPASAVYVRGKTRASEELGLHHEVARLPADASTEEVIERIDDFNARADVHGVLIQLPLPPGIDTRRALLRVDPEKDVDGFHPANLGLLAQNRARFIPCTPLGISELLRRHEIELSGRRAVVVGRSDIVGKPMALVLLHADATVTVCHSRTRDLAAVTREADVLVVAVGRPGSIRAEHVKPGATVVDVGMNTIVEPAQAKELLDPARFARFAEKGRALVGDVHYPQVLAVAGAITPVPGGVGPLTIAMLLQNTALAAERRATRG